MQEVRRDSKSDDHNPMLKRAGSDVMLINLAKAALESVSWPTEVQTGRLMFELGDGVRNTADVVEGDSIDGKRSAKGEL